MPYECTSCNQPVELDATKQYARPHRKRKGYRATSFVADSQRNGWCDGGGRAKEFLKEVTDAQS